MKFLIVLFTVFISCLTAPADPYALDMKQREKMGLECLKQVQIKREIIDKVVKTQIIPREGEDARKYKEYIACSYKKQGFQSDDGKMLFDNINEFLSRFYRTSELKRLESCKSVVGENDGEIAVNSLECILKHLRAIDKERLNDIDNQNENSV